MPNKRFRKHFLVGGQAKLDVDGDGKITAKDFKKLRSKTDAAKAFNLIGTGGPEMEVKGQGAVLAEKKRSSKAY